MSRVGVEDALRPVWLAARRLALVLSLILALGVGLVQAGETALGLGVGVAHLNDFPRDGFFVTTSIQHGLTRLLVLEPEIGYSQAAWEGSGYSGSRRDMNGSVHLLARTPARRVRVSGGLGIGYHAVRSEFRYPDTPQLSHDSQKLGIHALVGLDVFVTLRLWLFGVGRYDLLKGEGQTEVKTYAGVRWQLS